MAEPGPRKWGRTLLLGAVKVIGTGLLLWFAFRQVPAGSFRKVLVEENWELALLSIVVYTLGMAAVESVRYLVLGKALRGSGQPSFRAWVALYLESRPWMYLLPASAGAEAVLWAGLRGRQWTHRQCGTLVLGTRVLGLGIWVLLLGVALTLNPAIRVLLLGLPEVWKGPWIWSLGGAAILGVAAIAIPFLGRNRGDAPAPFPVVPMILSIVTGGASAAVVCISMILGSGSASLRLSFLQAAGFTAVLNIGMLLPITLAGLGLQEALLLRLGSALAIWAPGQVMALSAILHVQRLGLAILGGVLLLRGGGNRTSRGVKIQLQGQEKPGESARQSN